MVIGFGITTKTIAFLKKADGLVVGSQLCKEITRSLNVRQKKADQYIQDMYLRAYGA